MLTLITSGLAAIVIIVLLSLIFTSRYTPQEIKSALSAETKAEAEGWDVESLTRSLEKKLGSGNGFIRRHKTFRFFVPPESGGHPGGAAPGA